MKKFFAKNKIKTVIISMLMLISVFLVSACSYSDQVPSEEEGGTNAIGNIQGFKINYRPEIFEVDDFYFNFAQDTLITLSSVFGNANFERFKTVEIIDSVETKVIPYIYNQYNQYLGTLQPEDVKISYQDFENSKVVFFIDDIRNSVYKSPSTEAGDPVEEFLYESHKNANNQWQWNAPNTEINSQKVYFGEIKTIPTPAQNAINDIFTVGVKNERESFYQSYATTYTEALQVAILEILLEKQPTDFTLNTETNQVLSSTGNQTPAQILGNGETNGLKLEYKKQVEYVGISSEALEGITDYLLESVIGFEKYSNTEENNFDREHYKFLIEELVWNSALKEYYFSNENNEQDESLGSIYDVYSATVIQDFPTYDFFVKSEDKTAFSHIPAGQYRSIVIMPSEEKHLYSIMFYLVASREMGINFHYRYYDAEKDLLFESPADTYKTYIENEFLHVESEMIALGFEDENKQTTLYKMTKFNNDIGNGILKATTPKNMTYEMSQYYEQSANGGFGLNHEKFREDRSSFLEILFNVDNESISENLNNNFKVGIVGVWAMEPDDYFL